MPRWWDHLTGNAPRPGFRRGVALGVPAVLAAAAVLVIWPGNDTTESPPIRVGLYENEPKVYTDRDGEPAGLFVDLLECMAAERPWRFEYVPCEWPVCLGWLEAGELDLMPDVAATEERQARLDFHRTPVTQAWSHIYTRPDHSLLHFEDLAGTRVAVLADSVQQAYLDRRMEELDRDYQRVAVDSLHEAFAAVHDNRADAAVTNNYFARRHAAEFLLVETPITFNQVDLYFATPSGAHGDLLAAIDEHLDAWKDDPDSAYYDALATAAERPSALYWPQWLGPALIGGAVSIMLLLGIAALLRRRVTEQTRELEETNQRLQHVLESSPVVLYTLRGPDLMPQWVSANIERIFGFRPETALEAGWWERQLHPDDRATALREFQQLFHRGHLTHEYRLFDAYGKVRFIRDELQRVPGSGDNGTSPEVIGSWTDVTRNYEQQEQVRYLAHYDTRTGLPNRTLLHDRMDQSLERARTRQAARTVLTVDLDRFKSVNETLGMAAGDQVLIAASRRLWEHCGSDDTLARTGPDEFCLVVEREQTEEQMEELAERILTGFQNPLEVAGRSLVLTVSVGVARFPEDGVTGEQLMTAAELAAAQAVRAGGNAWRRFDRTVGEKRSESLMMESALRQAVTRNELVLYYQPQVALQNPNGSVVGFEALVRWSRPGHGMVSPGLFIPLAEETGLIRELDRWVLREACRQLAAWDREGVQVPRISVNLSAGELHSLDLVPQIHSVLEEYGLAPGRLELEITESMLMQAPERAVRILRQLDQLGVRLSMDDFGTGYSNLAYLRSLPLHQLKIDQSFVRDIGDAAHTESIIQAIIALAEALQLELVAEGIEQEHQKQFLEREGCTIGQGFLFGRPAPATELPFTLQCQQP